MFFLLVIFLLHTTVTFAADCPEKKRVGDTCYTRVAMKDAHNYGCKENCIYKKTNASYNELFCFKQGSLQVAECDVICGNGDFEPDCNRCGTTDEDCQGLNMKSDCVSDLLQGCLPRGVVVCGNGGLQEDCNLCPKTQDGCQGSNPNSDCKFDDDFGDQCVPRNPPTCGDGSTKTSCEDCGTEARQCQGYNPTSDCFIDVFTDTCIPRIGSFTEEESCLDCIKNDCIPCLSICRRGISAKCLECLGVHCALTCGLICA